jgi:hypothetical protein
MQVVSKKSIVKLSSFYEALVFFVEGEERIERNEHAQNVNENEGIWKKRKRYIFHSPPKGGGLLRRSAFSATLTGRFGMGTVRMGAEGRW